MLGKCCLGARDSQLWRVAGLFAALVGVIYAVQTAAPQSAAATTGLERAAGSSELSTYPLKYATARCDNDKHVVGGGAHIWDDGRKQARLTGLTPTTAGTFIATAETPGLTRNYEWKLRAYAICADKTSLRNYSIEFASENSKDTFKETPAECPDGTVAYGAGASVFAPYGPDGNGAGAGRVGLQLYRTDGALGISRATARADSLYKENWTLTSQVICADRSGTLQAEGTVAAGAEAEHTCSPGLKVHGIGGGGGITDGGLARLRKIYPLGDLSGVQVALTGTLFPSIGGMVASAVCGTG